MDSIGIIGAGTAGLHLALRLQANGIPVTLYTERPPEQLRSTRLPNTVAHNGPTRARERELGVNHWDGESANSVCVTVSVAGPMPFRYRGHLQEPFIFVDYRIYQSRLAEDFVARGGRLVVAQLDAQGVEQLARQHSLVVVSTGRAGVPSLFPRRPELSPYSTPQRLLFAALFRGIRPPEPLGMHINVSPGHGEIFESRLVTFQGPTGSLLIEALPGGALAELSTRSWEDKPRELTARLLELLPEHAPATFERVVPEEFELMGPMDWLSGTVTPVVRRGYAALGEGRFVLALGDAHVTNDPVSGLGANAASASAWALGGHILETLKAGRGFDEAFCQEAERRTWAAAEAATHWSNAQLQPPPPHVGMAMFAASQDQALADALVNNMVLPEKILATFATPESTEAFIAKHSAAGRGAGAS